MLALLLLTACTDITPIDDGQQVGEVILLKDLFTSVQLVKAGERVILFDGGYRARVVEGALEDQGVALADVTDVFITHGHPDHLTVIPELPNATVYALPAEAALIDENSEGAISIDRELVDRERIELGSASVEVFSVPGHTDGSAIYLVDGVMILGDCARQDRDGQLIVEGEQYSDDPELLLQNLRALADELEPRADEIEWLVPAHSAPLQGFGPLRDL